MNKKVDFLEKKIAKCKSEKSRNVLMSILNDEIVLQALKDHLTLMHTEPRVIERKTESGGIAMSMTMSYSCFSKRMDEEIKDTIVKWLVENIDKKAIDYWYSIKEKILNEQKTKEKALEKGD